MERGEGAQRAPRLFTNNPVRVCSPLPGLNPSPRIHSDDRQAGICHGFPYPVAVNRTPAAEGLSTFRVFGRLELTTIRTSILSRSLVR
jgi:hypothetical protein